MVHASSLDRAIIFDLNWRSSTGGVVNEEDFVNCGTRVMTRSDHFFVRGLGLLMIGKGSEMCG